MLLIREHHQDALNAVLSMGSVEDWYQKRTTFPYKLGLLSEQQMFVDAFRQAAFAYQQGEVEWDELERPDVICGSCLNPTCPDSKYRDGQRELRAERMRVYEEAIGETEKEDGSVRRVLEKHGFKL